ncbi:MAG TPA: TIM-barrel domain-containing protein [Opitutaceae bacterium]|nr:TIM-barrel domain-containing protein [Opitutaceae bacterium]
MNRRRSFFAASVAAVLLWSALPASAQSAGPSSAGAPGTDRSAVEKTADGIVLPVDHGWLKLQVRADNAIRVEFAKDRGFFAHKSLVVLPPSGTAPTWSETKDATTVTLHTARLLARIDRQSGAVSFLTPSGQPILAEAARTVEPAIIQGDTTFHVTQQWQPNADEALYGLGQQQLGVVDIKNYDIQLWQHNGTVVVPFLVSSRGYGILWDNLSYSRFGDLRPFTAIPTEALTDADGKAGALTATYFGDADFKEQLFRHRAEDIDIDLTALGDAAPNALIHPGFPSKGPVSVRWEGRFEAPTAGTYLFQTYSNNGAKVWIDGQLVVSNWWQNWLPYVRQARVALTAGTHAIRVDWSRDAKGNAMQLRWKTPAEERPTTLWSEVADGIDYTFVYGPQLDHVLAGYRQLTGQASLMPIWTFGLWQSRQRYETSQQSLDVLAGFRKRDIPVDTIVQDWFYWRKDQWGSHQFDPARFPDPQGWIDAIHHQYHAHVMISVWGKFYPGTANYDALHQRGFLYTPLLWEGVHEWVGFPYTDYDAFNPAARKLFWSQVRDALFTKKIDAWWMDATEPDISSPPNLEQQKARMNPTYDGIGGRVLNGYALMNSRGVYEGQRGDAPDQRVFILTRSGFAGIQRYGSATWSGDMPCTWEAMRRQIAAGLGYSISGVPYWSMDIGGFTAPPRFLPQPLTGAALDEWCELNARWFEFGAFVPLVRLHGESQFREPWAFGGDGSPAERAIVKYDRLRYRLLPYVYAVAGAVTQDGTTFMRPLVMDFAGDAKARELADEYLFGPAFLVAPVTEYKARSRAVYLPETAGGWFDFWTGRQLAGGRTIDAPAPYDAAPLFVRAGSIVPFGPDLQYTTEKRADPVTLFVYGGADGDFSLYEDDGLTYGYEKGAFTRIPMHWDEATQTFTLGARTSTFPGMLTDRTFNIVHVSAAHAVGYDAAPAIARTVRYNGEALSVSLK